MLFGPEKVIACPGCEHPALVFTLRSGNTIGAVTWTDGKMSAPMLPQAPPLTRCPQCGRFYWAAEARVLGQIDPGSGEALPAKWSSAQPIRALPAAELLQALDAGLGRSPGREQQLRTLAWWAANDTRRPPAFDPNLEIKTPLPPAAADNLQRLFVMLDPADPEACISKAEAARELADFTTGSVLLARQFPARYERAAAQIRKLIGEGNRWVRVLETGP